MDKRKKAILVSCLSILGVTLAALSIWLIVYLNQQTSQKSGDSLYQKAISSLTSIKEHNQGVSSSSLSSGCLSYSIKEESQTPSSLIYSKDPFSLINEKEGSTYSYSLEVGHYYLSIDEGAKEEASYQEVVSPLIEQGLAFFSQYYAAEEYDSEIAIFTSLKSSHSAVSSINVEGDELGNLGLTIEGTNLNNNESNSLSKFSLTYTNYLLTDYLEETSNDGQKERTTMSYHGSLSF